MQNTVIFMLITGTQACEMLGYFKGTVSRRPKLLYIIQKLSLGIRVLKGLLYKIGTVPVREKIFCFMVFHAVHF